jgi:hemerythrin-like domain-containing protein
MTIFERIAKHHEAIRAAIRRCEEDPGQFGKLYANLKVHHDAEDDLLYVRLLGSDGELRRKTLEAVEEHNYLEFMLMDLDTFPTDHERWQIKLHVLKEYCEHHFREEEEDLFALAEGSLSDDEQRELSEKFKSALRERVPCVHA